MLFYNVQLKIALPTSPQPLSKHVFNTSYDGKCLNAFFASLPDPESAFGADIHYHKKCWDKYVSNASSKYHPQNVCSREIKSMFLAHVNAVIFDLNEPRTLQGLLLDYQNMYADFGNSADGIKSSWIRKLLEEEFGEKIGFHNRYHKKESTLVFDASQGGSFLEVAINSWGVPTEQLARNLARRIHEEVKQLPRMKFPPTIEELEEDDACPNILTKFVGWLKSPHKKDPELLPNVMHIASAMKSLVTNERTKQQLQLTTTVYGLTRSKELVKLVKKSGFGVSYDAIKDLLASWAGHDMEQGCAPPQLISNFPGTAIVDNDDFICDTLTGTSGSDHRTNVMFVQPEYLSQPTPMAHPQLTRHNQLKNHVKELNNITPYKTVKTGIPPIRRSFDINPSSTNEICSLQLQHTLCRMTDGAEDVDPQEQNVGSFAGFQAVLSDCCMKSKPFYWLTLPKPPHKSVIHEVMDRLQKVVLDKGMPFCQLVGDQPVYALIVQLRNENPEKFSKIIPVLGAFHIQVAFIAAIGRRFEGSGLSDIIVSAEIIADKSVDKAMRGKHYRRIVRALQLVYEALQRRIIRQGLEAGLTLSKHVQDCLEKMRNHLSNPVLAKSATQELSNNEEFASFMEKVYATVGGTPMADYWLSFMQMVEILSMNIHAIKTRNWEAFKASLRLMLPWMRAYDRLKYSKWLVEYLAEMSTLPCDIECHIECIFAQSMTGHPYSMIPLDLWIEMTMNKGSKMKAGWKRILHNETMLTTHTLNANYVNRVRVSFHKSLASKSSSQTSHRENTTRRLHLDELAVQDLDKCFVEFEADPFDQTNSILRTLQSGEIASSDLQNDLLSAYDDGERLVVSFFDKRIFSREEKWDGVIHKNSRKTFLSPSGQQSAKTKANNTIKMENEAMANVISTCCDESVTLTDIMQHRVTSECLSIFYTNGTMVKKQKSKIQQMLNFVPVPDLRGYAAVVDMGMIWRTTTPTSEEREKNDETDYTWADYAEKMFKTLTKRHETADVIFLVNDPYDVEGWVKGAEDLRRCTQIDSKFKYGSKNVYWTARDKLPSKRDMSRFFTNKKNKMRLQQFLRAEFRKLLSRTRSTMFYSIQKLCENLSTGEREPMYECYLPEADQIIFYITRILRENGYQKRIVYDVADTDVIIQSAFLAHKEAAGALGLLRRKTVCDCQTLCTPVMSTIIVALHYLTSSDSTSGFFGHGKKSIMKTVVKNADAVQHLLRNVGVSINLSEQTLQDMILFVIRYIYNDKRSSTLAESRALLWKRMKRKTTQRIPPDEDSFRYHATRCNYMAFVCNNAFEVGNVPPPPRNHGWIDVDGIYHPVRHSEPPLPLQVAIKKKNFQCPRNESDVDESDTEESDTSDEDEDDDEKDEEH